MFIVSGNEKSFLTSTSGWTGAQAHLSSTRSLHHRPGLLNIILLIVLASGNNCLYWYHEKVTGRGAALAQIEK